MTKSRIFENLDLRRKADRDFCNNLLENHFRHLKLYSDPQVDLQELVVIWTSFERQKVEVHVFDRANLSGLTTCQFTTKEDLNLQKQLFLLNLRFWLALKTKILSIFCGEMFI